MSIVIVKEEYYRSAPVVNMDCDMVRATITVPKREWIKFKNHLAELERQEQKRKETFAEIFDIELKLASFKISTVIGDPNCTKCHGDGFYSLLGIGEYDEWTECKLCSCAKIEECKDD